MSHAATCSVTRCIAATAFQFACIAFTLSALPAFAVSCSVNQAARFPDTRLPDADAALEKGKAVDAIPIYQKALLANPEDSTINAALAEAYLDQEKPSEADPILARAITAKPHSAVLETVLAEAQLLEGRPWDAEDTITRALADDPCYPDAHLLQGRLLTYVSMRGTAAKHYSLAHQLAPRDADAFSEYLGTLSIPQRIAAVQAWMSKTNLDAASQKSWQDYLSHLEKEASSHQGACTLAPSDSSSTEIPLLPLMGNNGHVRAAGLDVKIEQHSTHLEIDTGASGLVLSTGAASRAGLQYTDDFGVSGFGSEGRTKAHRAYAKSIRIGGLEFHDCPVTIYENRFSDDRASPLNDIDGLIGMDTLRNFLVTLDYPRGKLKLDPLPALPNAPAEPISLRTGADSRSPNGFRADTTSDSLWQDRYIAPEMKDYSSVYHFGHFLAAPAAVSTTSATPASKDQIRLFILDTGADRTLVSKAIGEQLGKVHRDQVDASYGLGGKVKDLYYIDQITFNFARVSVVTNQVPAMEPESMASAHAPMQIAGFIGASALHQCVVHIDYRDGLVKLDYTPGPTRF